MVKTETKQMSVRFAVALSEAKDINPHFVLGKMRIAYHGDNANNSNISKEVFEEAIPTMFNCPIVARYDRDTDQFGSHDIEVIIKDHSIRLINATTPLGIVPESATWSWEKVMEGEVEREYLITDVLLWKRQEAVEHLMKIGTVDQSMECDFVQYHTTEAGMLVADQIRFSAFCLLESAKPCFADASVEVLAEFAQRDFKQSFMEMLGELKEVVGTINVGATFNKESHEEGGNGNLEDATKQGMEQNPGNEKTFAATYRDKKNALDNLFRYEEEKDEAGNVIKETYTWVADFDDQFVYVHRDIYEKGKSSQDLVGRYAYEFAEETLTATLTGEFEQMVIKWLTLEEYQQIEALREQVATQTQTIEALTQFKTDTLKAQRDTQVGEIVDRFADLEPNKDFQELKEHVDSFDSLEEFELKCFAIRGKLSTPPQKKPAESVRIPISTDPPSEKAPYGGLFDLYGGK